MQDNCILCGKEVQRGGFSAKVEGVILRPLCPDCDELCSKQPKKVFEEHRDIFERTEAERRDLIARQVATVKTHSAPPQRSQRERNLSKRYGDAYRVANAAVAIGNTIKTTGGVLAAKRCANPVRSSGRWNRR